MRSDRAQRSTSTCQRRTLPSVLAEASRAVMADFGALPLHFEMTTWAFRKGLSYTPRADQNTEAMGIKKAP